MSDELVFFRKFQITSADTDMYSRLRLGSLVNLFIQSAIGSADSLGFGLRDLHEKRLFWVLSRMTLKIFKPAKWYDELIVETWPKDIQGLLYLRDFIVKNQDGIDIAKATSGWLAIDINSKRPGEVSPEARDAFVKLKNKHALESIPTKLSPVLKGESFEVIPTYYDIDINGHVTSTRYIDWMMDMIPGDYHKENYPSELTINYLKETMPDQNLQIKRYQEDNDHGFEGINIQHESVAFRGRIVF